MSVAAVILAAGASRRLGIPKQDLVLGDETLMERALRTAQEAGLSPVIVVSCARRETTATRCSSAAR
jgi:molybdenum cofactor cytidylyltransferase